MFGMESMINKFSKPHMMPELFKANYACFLQMDQSCIKTNQRQIIFQVGGKHTDLYRPQSLDNYS